MRSLKVFETRLMKCQVKRHNLSRVTNMMKILGANKFEEAGYEEEKKPVTHITFKGASERFGDPAFLDSLVASDQ